MPGSLTSRVKNAINRPHADIHPADMEWLGIENIMRAAKALNTCRRGRIRRLRRRLHRRFGDGVFHQNGPALAAHGPMRDGVLLDASLKWPHLPALLAQCEEVIAQKGMRRRGVAGREWIKDLMDWSYLETHPAFLDFITSTDVIQVADEYLGFVPSLSTTVPPGLRLTESYTAPEEVGHQPYRGSQLFHCDIHDTPMVYVIVLIRDVTEQSGPFRFLSASASARLAKAVGYRKRGRPFRLSDDEVYRVISPQEVQSLTGRAGTVLFFDPSRCFHFGSRDAVVPRYQAMYALVSPCRADFTEWYQTPRSYPRRTTESTVRRLVVDNRSVS